MSEEVFQWPEDRDPAPEIRDLTEDGRLTGGLLVRVIRRTGEDRAGEALLLKEQALRIVLDGKRMTRLVCTGADLPALAAGWLLTSGFISRASDLASLKITGAGQEFLAEAERRTKTAQRTMAPVCARKIRREWLFHLADNSLQRRALIAAIRSIENLLLLANGRNLRSRRTGIDTDIDWPRIVCQHPTLYLILIVALLEFLILGRTVKQREVSLACLASCRLLGRDWNGGAAA